MCKCDTPLDSSGYILVRCLCLVILEAGRQDGQVLALMVFTVVLKMALVYSPTRCCSAVDAPTCASSAASASASCCATSSFCPTSSSSTRCCSSVDAPTCASSAASASASCCATSFFCPTSSYASSCSGSASGSAMGSANCPRARTQRQRILRLEDPETLKDSPWIRWIRRISRASLGFPLATTARSVIAFLSKGARSRAVAMTSRYLKHQTGQLGEVCEERRSPSDNRQPHLLE